ncbi:MAG: methyltransferase domain-containing protein, partial [Planctomycetota bacterium]
MTDVQALRTEAQSRFEQGDTEGALGACVRLLELEPDNAEALNDAGTLCFALGRAVESCSYYARAFELDRESEEILGNLKMACRAQGLSWQSVLADGQGMQSAAVAGRPARGAQGVSDGLEAEAGGEDAALACPCCGGRFRTFLPAGGVRKKPNRKCPGCGSLGRHRALWLYMVNRTNLMSAELRFLHFSPLPALSELLGSLANVDYVTADIASPYAALKMDITDILFRDEVFDAVLCIHVLEHV